MARNYVRRNQNRRAVGRGGKGLWLLAMLLTGLFIAGLIFLKQARMQAPEKLQVVAKNNNAKQMTKSADKTTSPKFDFYTMLPKVEMPDSKQPDTTTVAPPPLPPPSASKLSALENQQLGQSSDESNNQKAVLSGLTPRPEMPSAAASVANTQAAMPATNKAVSTSYVIQLGVFKDFAAADELKAQVTLQGFDVNVKTTQKGNNTLYRVWLGPYKTLAEARAQQKTLKENQIVSTLVKG